MTTAEVVVVGGGPAGAATAITLARAGREVVLVDKARFPRDKCCGDGLTTGAVRLLDALGLEPAVVRTWQPITRISVRSPLGRVVDLPLPDGPGTFGAVAPRLDLDAALVDLARGAGVKVHDGHALEGARLERDHVLVEVSGLGRLRARYAVGADGMWSPLRRLAGLASPHYLGESHAFRQYVAGVDGSAADRLWVWFDADLLPGYVWSFPLPDGRANVGFGVRRDAGWSGKDLKAAGARLLDRPHVREALGPRAVSVGRPATWPLPARIDRAPLGRGRVLLVGDAAGATDRLTGEGIGQALQTGILAAEAIGAAGALQPDVAQARYRAAVAATLVPDHRMAVAVERVFTTPARADAALRLAAASGWTRRNVARWLFEDEPRGIVLTPRRWHRHFLGRPGAWV